MTRSTFSGEGPFSKTVQTFPAGAMSAGFTKREAGGHLRELWSDGQRLSAEELVKDVTGGELEMTSIADRIGENIAPLIGR